MTNEQNINDLIIHFWLDHLEVYWTCKYEWDLFEKLDFDNSNYWELDEYTFTKNEVPRYEYKILFTKDNYSLFAYYKWIPRGERNPIATKNYIVVYSTAFKLLEYEEILWFLEFNFVLGHNRRFDICLDINMWIEELLESFEKLETGREYKKSWKLETRYIWEVKNSLNKRQLIRIYDKQKDIIEKKKIKLYWDYFDYENVTRVEIEVRQELAKNRSYYDIFDNSLLIGIFKNYIYKHSKLFDCIDWDKITLFKKQETIDPEKFQWLYYKTQRKNIFIWHAKTIHKMWFCPVRILIWEWLYQHNTALLLWKDTLKNIERKESNLKYDALIERAKRKDFLNLSSYEEDYE
jgi:hypothetical protein